MQRHVTYTFCAVLARTHDSKIIRVRTCHGKDSAKECVKTLTEMHDKTVTLNAFPAQMVLNDKQERMHNVAAHCAYCNHSQKMRSSKVFKSMRDR